MYVDANNLYGWAMPPLLPYKDLKWMSTTDIDNFDIHKFKYSYFLEVDLIYPYMIFIIILNFVHQIVYPQKRIR